MSRVVTALMGENWAMQPDWLRLMMSIAQRAPLSAPDGWEKRDHDLMAGPEARKLPGGQRAFVVDGVAVLHVIGPIFPRANIMTEVSGATSITILVNDLNAAVADPDVGAIVLFLDTPGGAVSGIAGFADAVAKASASKMVISHVAGVAASAGYWIASAANEIAIDRTGLVGSIGVVAMVAKQVAPGADGYVDVEIVSSNAPNKRPDPQSEDGAGEIRSALDAIEAQFLADVARGRKISVDRVIERFGGGGMKVGAEAVKAGMADRVRSYEDSLAVAKRHARLKLLKKERG